MKPGDLVKHMLYGRVGFIEWVSDLSPPVSYPTYVTVVIPSTGDSVWWDIDYIQVISESR